MATNTKTTPPKAPEAPEADGSSKAITDLLWTRRTLDREALAPLAALGVTLHHGPAVTIRAEANGSMAKAWLPRFAEATPPELIVTSGEGARRLAALLAPQSKAPQAEAPQPKKSRGTIVVHSFSREVARVLKGDSRFAVALYEQARSGADLAKELAAKLSKAGQSQAGQSQAGLVFAGAANPAFNFAPQLSAAGIPFEHWPLYRTEAISEPAPALRQLSSQPHSPHRAAVALFSPSAVEGFAQQWQALHGEPPRLLPPQWQAVAIGNTTAAAAAGYFSAVQIAKEPTAAAVIACLHQLAGGSPPVTMVNDR